MSVSSEACLSGWKIETHSQKVDFISTSECVVAQYSYHWLQVIASDRIYMWNTRVERTNAQLSHIRRWFRELESKKLSSNVTLQTTIPIPPHPTSRFSVRHTQTNVAVIFHKKVNPKWTLNKTKWERTEREKKKHGKWSTKVVEVAPDPNQQSVCLSSQATTHKQPHKLTTNISHSKRDSKQKKANRKIR